MSGGGSQSSDDGLRVNVGYPNWASGTDLPKDGFLVAEEGKDLSLDKPGRNSPDPENVAISELADVPLE